MISSPISRMVDSVRCPVSEPSPSPTRNPIPTSSDEPQPDLEHLVGRRFELLVLGPDVAGVVGGDAAVRSPARSGPAPSAIWPGGNACAACRGCWLIQVCSWAWSRYGGTGTLLFMLTEVGCGDALVARHQAEHGERYGDRREQDRQASRDAGQVQGQARPAGDHQVAEHAVVQVGGPGGRADHGGDDEPELRRQVGDGGEHARGARPARSGPGRTGGTPAAGPGSVPSARWSSPAR